MYPSIYYNIHCFYYLSAFHYDCTITAKILIIGDKVGYSSMLLSHSATWRERFEVLLDNFLISQVLWISSRALCVFVGQSWHLMVIFLVMTAQMIHESRFFIHDSLTDCVSGLGCRPDCMQDCSLTPYEAWGRGVLDRYSLWVCSRC